MAELKTKNSKKINVRSDDFSEVRKKNCIETSFFKEKIIHSKLVFTSSRYSFDFLISQSKLLEVT